MQGNELEALLQNILSQKGIGVARMGASFSILLSRYGTPTDVIGWRETGISEQCKVWNYGELQVWSDESGAIDRVFFNVVKPVEKCGNANLDEDLFDCRMHLHNCSIETFRRVFESPTAVLTRRGQIAEFSSTIDAIDVFAIFRSSTQEESPHLCKLRINTHRIGRL